MRRPVLALLVGSLCCGLLAGCSEGEGGGSGDAKDSSVASVTSPDGKQPSGESSDAGSGRKGAMTSMTMTEEEKQVLWKVWYTCLKSHGAQMFKKFPEAKEELPKDPEKRQPASAYSACEAKEPYLDPLFDKDGNPKYAEQTTAWIACMNREGVEVSGNWDDEFLTWGKVDPKVKDKNAVYLKCYAESYKW